MLERFFQITGTSPQVMMVGSIISILVGLLLIGGGIYVKSLQKQWWIALVILGVLSVFINIFQIVFLWK